MNGLSKDALRALGFFAVVLAFMGGVLISNHHARAAVGAGGYYQLDQTDDEAFDTWFGFQNTGTCNFSCGPATVGWTCYTDIFYGGYVQDSHGGSGNAIHTEYACDYYAPACVANQGQSCSGPSNACGVSNSGTVQCDGSCSATAAPANPAGYGNTCSVSNSCGSQTNTGSIQCNGSCSASAPSEASCTPACSASQGSLCVSGQNSCGMRNFGAIQCDGSCSASTPSDTLCAPGCVLNQGASCTSAANSCSMTNSGTIQCDGSCSATVPSNTLCPSGGNPGNGGGACTPNNCAASTCLNQSCDDGCGGTETGTNLSACTPGNGGGSCTDTGPVSLQALPSLVSANTPVPVTFTWTVSNASASCTLTGGSVNTTTGTPTSCSILGNFQTSVTVTGPTTFTLTCPGGVSATAVVRTVPKNTEF